MGISTAGAAWQQQQYTALYNRCTGRGFGALLAQQSELQCSWATASCSLPTAVSYAPTKISTNQQGVAVQLLCIIYQADGLRESHPAQTSSDSHSIDPDEVTGWRAQAGTLTCMPQPSQQGRGFVQLSQGWP